MNKPPSHVLCICGHSWEREHSRKRTPRGTPIGEPYCLVAGCHVFKHEVQPEVDATPANFSTPTRPGLR